MIIITGQTATGKTDLAIKLAQKNNGEIISTDSRQIYRHLNIITGKGIKESQKFFLWKKIDNFQLGYYLFSDIKVWLYDVINPNQYFSSYHFVQLANLIIEKIKKQSKLPIIVGGTYFYIKHLLYGFDHQVNPNWQLRNQLEKSSLADLQNRLLQLDPDIKKEINTSDWQNPRRLIRKIEILTTKKQQSNLLSKKIKHKVNQFIGLRFSNKEKLLKTIKNRVEKRINEGAVNEVKNLLKLGYNENDFGLKTIGYQQIIAYLKNKITYKEAVNRWVNKEIQYSKRQLTFMKKDPNIKWKEV